MNEVTFLTEPGRPAHAPGDFYQDPATGKAFILCQIDSGEYALICLQDGKNWNSPTPGIESALARDDRRDWLHCGPGTELKIRHFR